jgi:DNA-binding NarL/FixJ family response regulator
MGGGGRVRAVLVDDHRAVRQVVRAFLELDGRTDVVGEAGDGGEAVDVIRQTRPDVVVMDLEMPVANGLEVSAAVRRDLPDTRVVLFSSASNVSSEVQDAHRVDAFVRKDATGLARLVHLVVGLGAAAADQRGAA